ncbi:HEAT repeat-containing protein 4 [Heteronotia binoei]|uniref:HEAT repeat-containing protein 4 n=1 Tax=Heteronotia binoei TaxID=13085 RepID=UPI00292E668D|nr:HEAT repeat-containing protein 4 [Heteronotia binoei]
MEIPTFYKSKNPFPLESSLKVRTHKKHLLSHRAMVSIMTEVPAMYQKGTYHSMKHYAQYQKGYLKTIAKDFNFSKEVVKHRGPATLSYKEYDQKPIYDYSCIIHKEITTKKPRQPSRLKPLKELPPVIQMDIPLPKQATQDIPLCLEECIWKAKLKSTLAEQSLLVPIPPPPPPPSHDFPLQTFLTEPHDMLGTQRMTKGRPKRAPRTIKLQKPEDKDLGWEERLLRKLNKATAQWIVNSQSSWGGWVQTKPKGFKKQRYDWERIRYVLPSGSDVELLDEIKAEGDEVGVPSFEEKISETPLPVYYRIPSFQSRVLCRDDPTGDNSTVREISQQSPKLLTHIKHQKWLSSRVGKYSYTTQNIFEQELYFGTANIVHQETNKGYIVMDNRDEYCKHLQTQYPRAPELWSFRPPKKTTYRVQKGTNHWSALPTVTENFSQLGQAESLVLPVRRGESPRQYERNLSQDLCISRNILEQWKADWKFDPQWQSATIEGLMRGLIDVHVQNRINAILTCASAVLERPQKTKKGSPESGIRNLIGNSCHFRDASVPGWHKCLEPRFLGTEAKASEIPDIPVEIQPLLKNTLFDENVHVRMAAAICHYTIGERSQQAQTIVKNALIHGNSTDSWAAAQCLALEGITTFPVVKRILSQILDKKNDATEEQACLLLAQLSRKTGLVQCLLASELNSYQWKRRVLACKTFSRIPGPVSQDLKNKFVQLMWTDWKFDVRQAAARALGYLALGKEIHDQLWVKLKRGDCQTRVEALTLIGWLKLMTAKLLPSFLQCFADDFVAVRKEACQVAGALKIKEDSVFKCLIKIMQTDPLCKIKAFAIRALGQIGEASPQLEDLLLWAVHYEEDPGVRREACRSIITLQMQDEKVRAALLKRMILEPNEMVKEELNCALVTFNFQQEEEQEMIQQIKDKITTLTQKDLVIQKLQKLKEITERTWHEAHRIYREKDDAFIYRDLCEIFLDVIRCTPTGQIYCTDEKFLKMWTALSELLPLMGIPPNPWTQRVFLVALEAYYAEKETCAKKEEAPAKKKKESRVTKKSKKTSPTVCFVPHIQTAT